MEYEDNYSFHKMNGKIHLIIGCMYSGKSTELQRIIGRFNIIHRPYIVVNHSIDTRYHENGGIVTHNNIRIPCKSMDSLCSLFKDDDFASAEAIIIEEGQFFSDLYDFATKAADIHQKEVIIAGLSGDFKRDSFGDICRLIPHAEKITKLSALCILCKNGTPAHFTKKIAITKNIINHDTQTKQIDVGSTDKYIAVCRTHYNNES